MLTLTPFGIHRTSVGIHGVGIHGVGIHGFEIHRTVRYPKNEGNLRDGIVLIRLVCRSSTASMLVMSAESMIYFLDLSLENKQKKRPW